MKKNKGLKFLAKLRREKGWSKYRVAMELDVLPQTYQYYEEGALGIKLSKLLEIQKLFGLSDSRLMKLIRKDFN